MTFSMRPVRPTDDAPLLHSWVTEERAVFWGMTDKSVEEVRDVYAFLDSLSTHHAYLVHDDDRPVAIFQTYDPEHDPLGECYDVRAGDLGIHLFLAPGDPQPGFTGRLAAWLLEQVFADPSVQRVVAEPDVRNERSLRRMERMGLEPGPVVDLGHKQAQTYFLDRPA